MRRILYFAVVLAFVGGTVAAELHLRGASSAAEVQALRKTAADGLTAVPSHFGSWHLLDDFALTDATIEMLRCDGYVNRAYSHTETGEVVTMTLLVGSAGPLVAHTPEICIPSREYEVAQRPVPVDVSAGEDDAAGSVSMARMTFLAKSATGEKLRVYYGWRAPEGTWQAPSHPRWELGGEPLLYKLQVSSQVPARLADDDDNDPCHRFLNDLIPVLERDLYRN